MAQFKAIQSFTKTLKSYSKATIPTLCAVCNQFCKEHCCQSCYGHFGRNSICCNICAEPLSANSLYKSESVSSDMICGRCLSSPPQYQKAISPFLYSDDIRNLILQFKFSGHLSLVGFFAAELAIALNNELSKSCFPDVIIPIPLHEARLKQRGYNQAHQLGHQLAKRLGIPLDTRYLKRITQAEPQAGLSKQGRAKNIEGAFIILKGKALPTTYRHILLIDDVITTGATINEACKTLVQCQRNHSITVCSIARSLAFN
ncbi:MAG: ComF family protein [Saprospiraceae bacterium]|jgi:ComF family protein